MFEDLFISILAPGCIAGIALFLSNWFYQFINSPRISLDVGEIAETDDGIIRVVVKNEGRSAAENCKGKISIECSEDDLRDDFPAVINPSNFRAVKEMNLTWTNKRSGSITINAHDNEPLKVFARLERKGYSVVAVEGGDKDNEPPFHSSYICVLKYSEDKEYRGKINVTTSNAKEMGKSFMLKMRGDKINMEL